MYAAVFFGVIFNKLAIPGDGLFDRPPALCGQLFFLIVSSLIAQQIESLRTDIGYALQNLQHSIGALKKKEYDRDGISVVVHRRSSLIFILSFIFKNVIVLIFFLFPSAPNKKGAVMRIFRGARR